MKRMCPEATLVKHERILFVNHHRALDSGGRGGGRQNALCVSFRAVNGNDTILRALNALNLRHSFEFSVGPMGPPGYD